MTWLPRIASLGGAAFLVLLLAGIASLAAVGTVDGEPAAQWSEALRARGHWAQLAGFLHALAGLALAAFAWRLTRAPEAGPARDAATWARFAGVAWGATFVVGGAVLFSATELAGHHAHPEGAKTALVMGHLLYANPIAALLGGAFALGVGLSRPAYLPSWAPRASIVLGAIGMGVTLLGSFGGIGMLGAGPIALWLVGAALLVPWTTNVPSRDGASPP